MKLGCTCISLTIRGLYMHNAHQNKEEDIYERENPYKVPATREDEIYSQLKSWGVNNVTFKDIEYVHETAITIKVIFNGVLEN